MIRIGIDLGGTKTEIIALGPAGEILLRRRDATPASDYGGTLRLIARLVQDAERDLGCAPASVSRRVVRDGAHKAAINSLPGLHAATPPQLAPAGERPHPGSFSVGIGTPGSLSPATGLVRNANSTCLNGKPFRQDLERELGKTIRMANDADCFALSEALDGAARGASTVFGVILGTGVGGGIVVNGNVLSGPNAIAGEWGHNPLPWPRDDERPGPACYCGKSGCIETFLSGPGLALDHERATGERLQPEEIILRARNGEGKAPATLRRYEERLARALATVINVLDPEVIVLGGGMSNVESLYDRVPPLLRRWVFSDVVRTRLVRNAHGDSSGVRGAAMLWRSDE